MTELIAESSFKFENALAKAQEKIKEGYKLLQVIHNPDHDGNNRRWIFILFR